MSNRARWLLILSLTGLAAGVLRGQPTVAYLSLSAFIWVLAEWLRFQFRVRVLLPRLKLRRLVNQRDDQTGTLWAGRQVQVELQLATAPRTSVGSSTNQPLDLVPVRDLHHLHNIILQDVVPEIFGLQFGPATGTTMWSELAAKTWQNLPHRIAWKMGRIFGLWSPTPIPDGLPPSGNWWSADQDRERFQYQVTTRAAGVVTFPGVRLTMVDSFGFFQLDRFIALEQTFRILPDFFQSAELRPDVKRHNSLPSHGIHRLKRSGVSSELLELREYVAGDPPKSIAWKASARRETLMTRQYESEVPVRVQFFIDGSVSTRVGGYGLRLLDQQNYVVASVAKAAIAVGDPITGSLIDESRCQRLPWLAGDLGFLRMLRSLAEFADRPPPTTPRLTPRMLIYAMAICQQRYPELLERPYYSIPFSFFAATREKYRLVGVLAEVLRLTPREQAECYIDDRLLANTIGRLLFAAGLPWMAPLLAEDYTTEETHAQSMGLFATAISRSIARARDNEVFVILADPYACAQHLDHLLPAVKLALAKHHRVAFVCPTPTFERPQPGAITPRNDSVGELLRVAEQARARELKAYLKRELVRLGAAVTYSGERSAIQMVLSEMDLARAGRSRVHGARS
ncbi:MAG: DUF58 domain-containing protein [Pirellulaceae bacterium]